MKLWGQNLIPYDWYLYKRRWLGQAQAQGKDHVKTDIQDRHLQAKEGALRKNQTCWQLDLWILPSRTVRKLLSVVLAPQFVVLGYDNPIKLIQSLVIIVVTPSSSKAINGYFWFPAGVFSRWSCCYCYCLLSWTFFYFPLALSVMLPWLWKCFDSLIIHHPHTVPLNHIVIVARVSYVTFIFHPNWVGVFVCLFFFCCFIFVFCFVFGGFIGGEGTGTAPHGLQIHSSLTGDWTQAMTVKAQNPNH